MECGSCGIFVCARVKEDWDAESLCAYMCDICLTRNIMKAEGNTKGGNKEEIKDCDNV